MIAPSEDSDETRLENALASIEQGRISTRQACEVYRISRATLYRRKNGILPRKSTRANSHRLSSAGEVALLQHILDLDDAGFPPTIRAVRDAANCFSAIDTPVGKHWARRFVDRTPEIKARLSRSDDEDSAKINDWFKRFLDSKTRHEVSDANVYNMDETVFQMGMINSTSKLMASKRKARGRKLQSGTQEWITSIICIGAGGHDVPPFLIVKGNNSCRNCNAPDDWMVCTTKNGWTDNDTGMEWLKHFDAHTSERAHGQFRMLMVDGHESHVSVNFRTYCHDHNILLVCVPAHSSCLLQPLDVGFFPVMNRAYHDEIGTLIKNGVTEISQTEFFPAFKGAYQRTMSDANVSGCFSGAGLVPYCPNVVISKLSSRIDRPNTPPSSEMLESWQSRTPRNRREAKPLCALVARGMQGDPQLLRDFRRVEAHLETLYQQIDMLREEVDRLQAANTETVRRRGGRRLETGARRMGVLKAMSHERKRESDSVAREKRKCTLCGQPGHNRRTCGASGRSNEEYEENDDEEGNENVDSADEFGGGTTTAFTDGSSEVDESTASSISEGSDVTTNV